MSLRLEKIYARLEQENLDGLIVSSPANISYLVEFKSRDSYLLVSRKKNVYFTDSRYIEEAKENFNLKTFPGLKANSRRIFNSIKGNLKETFVLRKTNGSVFKLIAGSCIELGLGRIGFEERYLPFAEYKKIKEGLKKKAIFIPIHNLIEELRQIKEPHELEGIREAIRITSKALEFIKNFIKPGQRELEVVAELARFIRYQGAENEAFDIIVASGPNSSFPHHCSSQRKLKNNEPVLIDIGVEYKGYKSDLTRVFFLGKIDILKQRIYNIVLEAQNRAIKIIKQGCLINEVDKASRQFIREKGYADFFGHNLGHGIGLEVHELPTIGACEEVALEAGMVFSVEPAIYLPGKFGIRIEDLVLVTKKGCEVISKWPCQ
ncbi:MAG: Xaa-Pro peptidase family protein [Candidatus Omnitrophota bacterium]|nr:Xaa-Pro peptidase family protein [Candidatus Omnitrophota bacterium]